MMKELAALDKSSPTYERSANKIMSNLKETRLQMKDILSGKDITKGVSVSDAKVLQKGVKAPDSNLKQKWAKKEAEQDAAGGGVRTGKSGVLAIVKQELKPVVKPADPKVVPKVEPKVESKSESKAEAKPCVGSECIVNAVSHAVAEARAERQAKLQPPTPKSEPKVELKVEQKKKVGLKLEQPMVYEPVSSALIPSSMEKADSIAASAEAAFPLSALKKKIRFIEPDQPYEYMWTKADVDAGAQSGVIASLDSAIGLSSGSILNQFKSDQMYKQEFKRDIKQEFKPEFKQEFKPEQLYKRDIKQEFKPEQLYKRDIKQEFKPEQLFKQEFKSEQLFKQEFKPEQVYKQEFKPEQLYKQEFKPEQLFKQEFKPEQVYKQEFKQTQVEKQVEKEKLKEKLKEKEILKPKLPYLPKGDQKPWGFDPYSRERLGTRKIVQPIATGTQLLTGKGLFTIKYDVKTPWNVAKGTAKTFSQNAPAQVSKQFTNANMKISQFTNKPVATGTFTTANLGLGIVGKKQAAPAIKKQAAPSVASRFTSANVGIGTFKPTENVVGNSNFAANIGGMVKSMAKPASRKSIKKMVGLKRSKKA
jgi:hypothetical protein